MNVQPKLTTERLLLRPFHYDDCQQITLLAGDKQRSQQSMLASLNVSLVRQLVLRDFHSDFAFCYIG